MADRPPPSITELRRRWADRPATEVDDPILRAAMWDPLQMRDHAATLLGAPRSSDLGALDIALVGVPFDLGATDRPGARLGPSAVRQEPDAVGPLHHHTRVNPFALARVSDVGDVDLQVFDLEAGIRTIEAFYRTLRDAGVRPVSIGGDHSVTYPILRTLGDRGAVGLVHIDAHCDTTGTIAGSKLHHGGPFLRAVLDGVLDPRRTIQIGIRGAAEVFWEFSYEAGMTVVHVEAIDELGIDAIVARARDVVGDGPTYVSFDIDALDPAFAPGTGTPEPGGLTPREAFRLLRGLRGLNVIGGDVVELAPAYDPTYVSALNAKQLLFEILCLAAESRAARGPG